MIATRTSPLATVLLAFAATACGAASRSEVEAAPPAASGSTAELEAVYRARMDSARLRFTAADVRFMTGMIAHHAQALVMAALAPTHGASPSVQTLCARIINAQNDEIVTLQGAELHRRRALAPAVEQARCTFEFVYFSRPDSDWDGRNVHAVRERLGMQLAEEAPADADQWKGVADKFAQHFSPNPGKV